MTITFKEFIMLNKCLVLQPLILQLKLLSQRLVFFHVRRSLEDSSFIITSVVTKVVEWLGSS